MAPSRQRCSRRGYNLAAVGEEHEEWEGQVELFLHAERPRVHEWVAVKVVLVRLVLLTYMSLGCVGRRR